MEGLVGDGPCSAEPEVGLDHGEGLVGEVAGSPEVRLVGAGAGPSTAAVRAGTGEVGVVEEGLELASLVGELALALVARRDRAPTLLLSPPFP